MSKLNNVQFVAQKIGVKCGPNTFFSSDINDPNNQCVYFEQSSAISLGLVDISHLPGIAKERLRPHFPNVFAPSLD